MSRSVLDHIRHIPHEAVYLRDRSQDLLHQDPPGVEGENVLYQVHSTAQFENGVQEAVLSMHEYRGSLLVSWIDRLDNHEGLSSFHINFNYRFGEWEEYWMD